MRFNMPSMIDRCPSVINALGACCNLWYKLTKGSVEHSRSSAHVRLESYDTWLPLSGCGWRVHAFDDTVGAAVRYAALFPGKPSYRVAVIAVGSE